MTATGTMGDSLAAANPPLSAPMQARTYSIYEDCWDEANRYKWYRSEEAGRDLGEYAIRQWVKDHWGGYLRAKWLEHLQGKTFWIELSRCDFGILQREFRDDQPLFDAILEMLKSGKENLDVIRWAIAEHHPLPIVHRILAALDINSSRLAHQFDSRY